MVWVVTAPAAVAGLAKCWAMPARSALCNQPMPCSAINICGQGNVPIIGSCIRATFCWHSCQAMEMCSLPRPHPPPTHKSGWLQDPASRKAQCVALAALALLTCSCCNFVFLFSCGHSKPVDPAVLSPSLFLGHSLVLPGGMQTGVPVW